MRDSVRRQGNCRYSIWVIFSLITFTGAFADNVDLQARPATVADSIEMAAVGEPLDGYFDKAPAVFSPDGTRFAVVVRSGDIQTNTNVYKLLLFRPVVTFADAKPDVL